MENINLYIKKIQEEIKKLKLEILEKENKIDELLKKLNNDVAEEEIY